MAKYRQTVLETRVYEVVYTVEADSPEEAEKFIAIGQTVEEESVKLERVQDRDPSDSIELVEDD